MIGLLLMMGALLMVIALGVCVAVGRLVQDARWYRAYRAAYTQKYGDR